MDRETSRISSRFLSYALPYFYLLTSIAFYLHTYDSAQVKITLVQMGGTVLIGFWYVSLVTDFRKQWEKYGLVALPLLACLVSGLLSFARTAYPGPCLDETLRRVFYIHLGLIALREFYSVERIRRLILFLLIAVAISAAYGVLQFVDFQLFPNGANPQPGIDPFVWRQAFGGKIFSTFGNPNFFGNFLVILTPITLALLLKRNAERLGSLIIFAVLTLGVSALLWHSTEVLEMVHMASWHSTFFILVLTGFSFYALVGFSFLGLLYFFITVCIVVTESKGSWMGYTASFVLFWTLVLFYFPQFQSVRLRRIIRGAAVLILTFAVASVVFYSRARVSSVRFRVCTWMSTWEMTLMHPVLGNGVGSFRIIYPAVRRPQIFHIEGKHNTETDHSENEYLEVLQDEGIIGFGMFLWMIASFSVLGMRGLGRYTEGLSIRDPVTGKRKTSQDLRAFYMLGILAAFWGMLMHNFVDVSLRFVSSGIFLWLLAGLIGAMVVHDPMPETDEKAYAMQKAASASESSREHPRWVLTVLQGFLAILLACLTWKIWKEFDDAQGTFPGTFGDQLLWSIAWAAMIATLVAAWSGLIRVGRSLKQAYGLAVLAAVLVWPLYIFWGYFMADVFHNRGIFYSKQAKWDDAIASYRKVVELNPNYIMAYYFLGNVYTDRWGPGDVEHAMAEYKRAWAIAPNYVQSHHQAGLVYLKKGQDERQKFEELRRQGRMQEAMSFLSQAQADWEQALVYFKKYHAIDPVFYPNYARMGWVYMQMAELAPIRGRPQDVATYQEAAENAYQESLYAWVCRTPPVDLPHEHWDGTHRHFDGEMFANLGNARFIRGNMAGAARAYNLSLWQSPNNVQVMKNLATVFNRLGKQGETIQLWNKIRQLAPQDPEVQRVFHGNNPAHS